MASIYGAEGWEDIEEFGIAKHEWFNTFLELKNGILSHDTFRRVFILFDAEELKASYLERIRSAVNVSQGQLVNIDGEKLRGSKRPAQGKEALTIISACATHFFFWLVKIFAVAKSSVLSAPSKSSRADSLFLSPHSTTLNSPAALLLKTPHANIGGVKLARRS